MTKLLLILSFTLGLTTAAQSGFFENRVDWNQLPQNVKEGYAVLFGANLQVANCDRF